MRFAVLGSGSGGNATLVCTDSTAVLVDAGFSAREIRKRMSAVGLAPDRIAAILLTHEHGDHAKGAGVFARAHGTPVYMTAGTQAACRTLFRGDETIRLYRPGYGLLLGDLLIEPFVTVHDAADPVALTIADANTDLRLGIATDFGRPTTHTKHALQGCDGLVIESNHDEAMLWAANYPPAVKSRIASSHGHLSNQAAAAFVCTLVSPRLAVVVLAHLSEESNTPALAKRVMSRALARRGFVGKVLVADSDNPTPLLNLVELRKRATPAQYSLF